MINTNYLLKLICSLQDAPSKDALRDIIEECMDLYVEIANEEKK